MGSGIPFTANVEAHHGVAKISLTGELDMATVPILNEHLATTEESGATAIILDLRDVTFMDSTGLFTCLRARDRAADNGHRFMVVQPSPSTKQLFEMTGTGFLLGDTAQVLVPSTNGHGAASPVKGRGPSG